MDFKTCEYCGEKMHQCGCCCDPQKLNKQLAELREERDELRTQFLQIWNELECCDDITLDGSVIDAVDCLRRERGRLRAQLGVAVDTLRRCARHADDSFYGTSSEVINDAIEQIEAMGSPGSTSNSDGTSEALCPVDPTQSAMEPPPKSSAESGHGGAPSTPAGGSALCDCYKRIDTPCAAGDACRFISWVEEEDGSY